LDIQARRSVPLQQTGIQWFPKETLI
jgi:hypothetical protein